MKEVNSQYYFNHLFENTFQSGSFTQYEANRVKERYVGYSLSEQQVNEYIESQREASIKLIKNQASFIETLLYQTSD